MIPVTEVRRCNDQGLTNKMLAEGWVFLGVTPAGNTFFYHLGRPVDETPEDWREPFVQFLDNLDPAEVDRKVLESATFDEGGVTAGVLRYLKEVLGCRE